MTKWSLLLRKPAKTDTGKSRLFIIRYKICKAMEKKNTCTINGRYPCHIM